MKQIVYVVYDLEDGNVLGVYNEMSGVQGALEVYNGASVVVTPVLVDAPANTARYGCENNEELNDAMKAEILSAMGVDPDDIEDIEEDEEDEDEDDEYEEDEDEEEESLRGLLLDIRDLITNYLG